MFKLRCLVFPFHWLKGLAGLCLAPSRLLSPFPVKGGVVPCAAYLRRYSGISCPFYFDHAGGGDEWAVTAHWQLTLRHPSSCLMFIHEARWKIQPAFLETGESLSILSPVLFSGWSAVGPTWSLFSTFSWAVYLSTSSVLRFFVLRKSKSHNQMCFFFWDKEMKSLHCILIVAWSRSSTFQKNVASLTLAS